MPRRVLAFLPRGADAMRPLAPAVARSVFALLLLAGCAQTTVSEQQSYAGPRLARPNRIIVYDFAASASDLPAGYAIAVAAPPVSQTADDLSLGRKLGAEVAKNLISELQGMGLPAVPAAGQAPPQVGDIAIVGYFVSVESAALYFPFVDLIVADPYKDIADALAVAFYIGQSREVGGTLTDMVAFAHDDVLVQVWIGVKDKLPRRSRAIYSNDPTQLRHQMDLLNWRLDAPVPAGTFASARASRAKRIPFARPEPIAAPGVTSPASPPAKTP